MAVYDIGDIATVTTDLRDLAGNPVDADVTIAVAHNATGTLMDPPPTVTSSSTGHYEASFPLTLRGLWRYTWTASGTVTAVDTGDLVVADRASLAAIAAYIGTSIDDPLLVRLSVVAEDMIVDHLGEAILTVPLSIREHAITHLTSELYSRRAAPGGVLWAPGGDSLARLSRDVMASVLPILSPYTAGMGIA